MTTFFSNKKNVLFVVLIFLYAFTVLRNAYVADDAYITLRTVDNFVNGYGLTWNTIERVQAYTHPLWMLLLSAIYFFTREAFYTTIFLSIIISITSFTFVILNAQQFANKFSIIAGLTILILSKAFIDYSTSGLENPLSHLILAISLYLLFSRPFSNRKLFILSFTAGLAALNRIDTIVLYLPPLVYSLFEQLPHPKRVNQLVNRLKWMVLGFSPLIVWEIFSVIYYGFPFPNTAYAKLNFSGVGIQQNDLFEQGYLYFLNSLRFDPITLFTIFLGIGLTIILGTPKEKSVVLGGAIYLFYIFYIGGDFMSGRFFSSVLLLSVILLNRYWSHMRQTESIVLLIFILAFGFSSSLPTFSIEESSIPVLQEGEISDEKRAYFMVAALIYDKRNTVQPYHEWVLAGKEMKRREEAGIENIFLRYTIGYVGYFAGPNVIIIDYNGLSDPLLARLPPKFNKDTWRPGHLSRPIPDGYIESVKSGENKIADPSLSEYYDKLILITRKPIWNWERFITIYKINTGQYDYLVRDYVVHSRQ